MKYCKFVFILLAIFNSINGIAQTKNAYPGFYDEINNCIKVDSSSKLYLSAITISGNHKTKDYIILRELKVKKGDSVIISDLYKTLEESHNLIYNTSLFLEVRIQPILLTAYNLKLEVVVKERWYIYPTPQFKLIDRNFNEWWKTYNADLSRVVYGIRFLHYNISGRGDQLKLFLLNGYARNISISYSAPYSNKKLDEGFSFNVNYTENREFSYKTSYDNKALFYKKDDFSRKSFSAAAVYVFRKGFFKKHYFTLQYNYIKADDSLITSKYNSNYFGVNKSEISFPDIGYSFVYTNTDNINFPLKGKVFTFSVFKRGFGLTGGINSLVLDASLKKYFTHPKNFYSNVQIYSKLKLPFEQSYLNQRIFGYGLFYLRGLEYYVIDGVAAALTKYTFSKKIISFKVPLPFKVKAIPYIPFSFFAKSFFDAGYCYNKREDGTRLNNVLLYTGGFGIDMLSLYDFNLSLEYSFNQLKEKGLFLHIRGSL